MVFGLWTRTDNNDSSDLHILQRVSGTEVHERQEALFVEDDTPCL